MSAGGPLDYRFVWNNHRHPQAVLSYEMGVLTAGGNVKDLSVNGNDGTPQNNPTYVAPLIRPKSSKAMDVDGATQVVLAGPAGMLKPLSRITIECVCQPDTIGNQYLWNYIFAGADRFGLITSIMGPSPANWIMWDGLGGTGYGSRQGIITGRTYHTIFTIDGDRKSVV